MADPTTDVVRLAETCREWPEGEDRCQERADFILWGKLSPREALGPRCYDHAVKHTGHAMVSQIDQWAVFDLRRVYDLTDKLAAVEALLAKEIADGIESNVRSEVAGIRCLDCNLRYEERQEYGCHESGRGHSFDDEDVADAERSARADAIDYVTLSVADLRTALGADYPPGSPADDKERP